jgi:hypothetical protein
MVMRPGDVANTKAETRKPNASAEGENRGEVRISSFDFRLRAGLALAKNFGCI